MIYEELPEGMDFSTKFDTYILAYCPDTCSWFATNERFFYYEYPKEFASEDDAIAFFKNNADDFYKEEIRIGTYRPSFLDNKIMIDNTEELIDVNYKNSI